MTLSLECPELSHNAPFCRMHEAGCGTVDCPSGPDIFNDGGLVILAAAHPRNGRLPSVTTKEVFAP